MGLILSHVRTEQNGKVKMDIHPPMKPVESLKESGIHLLIVTLGILIALSLNCLLEWLTAGCFLKGRPRHSPEPDSGSRRSPGRARARRSRD